MYVHVCIHVYMYVYIYIYVYMYIFMYMYMRSEFFTYFSRCNADISLKYAIFHLKYKYISLKYLHYIWRNNSKYAYSIFP